jgi:hypothetical protein
LVLLQFFIGAEHGLFLMRWFIATYIPDVTYSTDLQLKRQGKMTEQHFMCTPTFGCRVSRGKTH